MKRFSDLSATITLVVVVLLSACAPAATGEGEAASVFVPQMAETPAVDDTQQQPTRSPSTTVNTTGDASVSAEPFVLNGVTLPFARNEAMVMDRYNLTVFDSFNPFIPNGVSFDSGYGWISVEYLWYLNMATGELVPWLGESWEYNDDDTVLKLHLREGVTWNDGEPFTADDVVFTLNMLKDNPTLVGPSDSRYWDAVYAEDPLTVVIEMTAPRPRQHSLFIQKTGTGFIIVPEHIWAEQNPATFQNFPPVTTGPYMYERAYEEQKFFVWSRNENYWNQDRYYPAPGYVIYRVGTQDRPEVQLAEAKDNTMDMMRMQWDSYVPIREEIPHFNNVNFLDPCPRGAWFNGAGEHVEHPEFRRALSMLMNREKWAENLWAPASQPATAFWANYPHMDAYDRPELNDKWGIFQFDPDAALALMKTIGYRQEGNRLVDADGIPVSLEITTPSSSGGREYTMAQDFVEELKAVGIDATLKHLESGVFFNTVDSGEFQVGFWWYCGANTDPLELYEEYTCDNVQPVGEIASQGNSQRICDPELDAVLAELSEISPDDPAAAELYTQAYDLWAKNLPGVPLIETIYSTFHNTTFWDGMMSEEDVYTVPLYHWSQIIFVPLNVTARGD